MLATFIIGLREGLEAALIVGIIAAFLRNNGKSLVSMWIGVALAILLSIAVGVGLELAERALPQAEQEALETVIGFVAVFFVTGMIVWMNNHAREMKRRLEADAAQALRRSSTYALASMAFLAVLKEGFETSVFLMATFSVAQSAAFAATGAVLGLLIAIGVGWGIYAGGVRFNLSRFFRYTAGFLVLVAAGLVIASLRTAHEAGWIVAGQQATVNLGWLVAPGTVQSALITGVLGIPADPRLIEVIGWLAYLVPVVLYVYWPQSRRPQPRTAARLKYGLGAVIAVIAIALVVGYPKPQLSVPATAELASAKNASTADAGTVQFQAGSNDNPAILSIALAGRSEPTTLSLPENERQPDRHKGEETSVWTIRNTSTPSEAPSTLTLSEVVALAGNRIPVGLNPQQHPGPFNAAWSVHRATRVWITSNILLDAIGRSMATVTLSGSELLTPRTFTVENNTLFSSAYNWQVSTNYVSQTLNALDNVAAAKTERQLWVVHLPIVLTIIALLLLLSATRTWFKGRHADDTNNTVYPTHHDHHVDNPEIKGAPYAAN